MIEFGHLTHVGLRRELNEDTYYGDSELGLWLEKLASRGIRFRANIRTKIFCHPTCRHIRRSKPENVVDLHGIEETVGYQPCEVCRPV